MNSKRRLFLTAAGAGPHHLRHALGYWIIGHPLSPNFKEICTKATIHKCLRHVLQVSAHDEGKQYFFSPFDILLPRPNTNPKLRDTKTQLVDLLEASLLVAQYPME